MGEKNRFRMLLIYFLAFLSSCLATSAAADFVPLLRDDFDDLADWRPLTFPKIPRHTEYRIVKLAEGVRGLLIAPDNSASGLVHLQQFDPMTHNILRWRWRVENVYRRGDATRKEGDDYSLRIYVLFAYDRERASLVMRAKYGVVRRIYGEYPPHASLNYIWANREHDRRILPNPFTERSQMIILRAGEAELGRWLEEEVDILADYREAFGEDPPRQASLAIMGDADNTGEAAVSLLDYIELGTISR